jgi:hypothetical protein
MSENTVKSLVVEVEHFPGTVKTKKATIYITNHKTGESQTIECVNNSEAMRCIAVNVLAQDMAMIAKEHADEKWLKSNGIAGNA